MPSGSNHHNGLETTPSTDTSCEISASAQAYQITFLKQPLYVIELADRHFLKEPSPECEQTHPLPLYTLSTPPTPITCSKYQKPDCISVYTYLSII